MWEEAGTNKGARQWIMLSKKFAPKIVKHFRHVDEAKNAHNEELTKLKFKRVQCLC